MKLLRKEEEGYYITPMQNMNGNQGPPSIPGEIQAVLDQFQPLFQAPIGLPPQRDCDHAISLKEGASIPNIRPYKYPHY